MNTACIHRLVASTMDIKDNILWNNRASMGAAGSNLGRHYAIWSSVATGTLTTNFNDLLAAANGGAIGFLTSDRITLANWQAAAAGFDTNSINADPLFVDPTNATTPNLHLMAGSPARDIATNVGVTSDFDGESRPGANATFDIGADEFDGVAPVVNDMQATAFVDPTNGGSKLANTAFSPQASFTNNGTAAQTGVPVRYRICADGSCTNVLYNQTAAIASINPAATTTVTFPSVVGGLSAGTYTIKAKAELGTDTVPANDEITGTLIIKAPLSGNVNVGVGQTYTTLTAAIADLNSLGVSAATTVVLKDATYTTPGETFPITIGVVPGASATNTITIKPDTGIMPTISGSSASCIINLNGSDYVTINGSNGGGRRRHQPRFDHHQYQHWEFVGSRMSCQLGHWCGCNK